MAVSILHSPAAFKDKMRWAGIEEDHQVIISSKYKNLQQFAQSCGVSPDQVDDNALPKKVVTARYQVEVEGTLTNKRLWQPAGTERDREATKQAREELAIFLRFCEACMSHMTYDGARHLTCTHVDRALVATFSRDRCVRTQKLMRRFEDLDDGSER